MKKLLIITYYWIPSGGAGVQRWVKFVKYLRQFGWEPIIYTPENPEYPSIDLSLVGDIPDDIQVIKTPIWEPYDIYRNLLGKRGENIQAGFISENKQASWKDKLSIWIRGNFLIPDPRKFWVKPSVRHLKFHVALNLIDAVITTGPPHSMHLIGKELKKHFPELPWIADFRDPWTNIDFYKDLRLTSWADNLHHRLEKGVVTSADCITTVSKENLLEYQTLGAKRIELITNGYDEDDFKVDALELDKKFTISHIGTLNQARNAVLFWKVLGELIKENADLKEDLQIQLVGKVDFSVLDSIRKYGLEDNLKEIDYLSHSEAVNMQVSSQVLLLLINNSPNAKGILTGKFFEYLAAKRPILAIGPTDGEVASVLNETNAGRIADFHDEKKMRESVLTYYKAFKTGVLNVEISDTTMFTRKNLTKQLAELLNQLILS